MVPKIVCMKIWQLFAGGPEIRYSEKIKRGEKHLQVEKKNKNRNKSKQTKNNRAEDLTPKKIKKKILKNQWENFL